MIRDLGNPQDTTWVGRQWSAWIGLYQALDRSSGPAHEPGIYRLRDSRSDDSLLYIGESGDVRSRPFQLRNAISKTAAGASQGPPHWAGACIFYHERQGARIEVSWLLEVISDEAERKGIECEYIAAHRWAIGRNPECQFVAISRRQNISS